MKKIFSVLIALAIVFSMTVPAMAAESYGYTGDGESYGSGQIEVTHHSYSTFQLDIPLYADSSMPNYITAYNPNLEDEYQIEIYVTNLNEDGTIATMTVDASGETEAIAKSCTEDAFLSQFIGKKGPFTADVVAGATFTSNAVINAVNSLFGE